MPAWAAAFQAATAHAALEHLDSPMALFAAGAYFEQQRLIAYLDRRLRGGHRQATRQALGRYHEEYRRELRRRARSGGAAGAGRTKRLHTELLRRVVQEERPKDFPALVACLQDEETIEMLIGQDPALDMHYVTYKDRPERLEYELLESDEEEKVIVARDALERAFKRLKASPNSALFVRGAR